MRDGGVGHVNLGSWDAVDKVLDLGMRGSGNGFVECEGDFVGM